MYLISRVRVHVFRGTEYGYGVLVFQLPNPAALVKLINYSHNLLADLHYLKTMSRTIAGNENNLLEDSLLDVAMETQDDNGDNWLSHELALLGLTET